MYLARFFHRSPHDADRRLVLASNGPRHVVMDTLLGSDGTPACDGHADIEDAIQAFRIASRALGSEGYVETVQVDYTLDRLPAHPETKPAWQRGLDEAFLDRMSFSSYVDNHDLSRLSETAARDEPFYRWLVAAQWQGITDRAADALTAAIAAQKTLARRLTDDAPFYAWSLRAPDVEARVYATLCEALLADGQTQAALAAIAHACLVGANSECAGRKAWIQCAHFPEQQDDAFDQAYRYAKFGGYDAVVALPAYAAYVQRRDAPQSSLHDWRWSVPRTPLPMQELQRIETQLGLVLPEEYRRFLAHHAHREIVVRSPRGTAVLRFFDAATLVRQRDRFVDFLVGQDGDAVEMHLRQCHGLSARDLLPIAGVVDSGNCVLLYLGAGERYGHAYRWYDADAWDPLPAGCGLDALLAGMTEGFAAGEGVTLDFVGLSS